MATKVYNGLDLQSQRIVSIASPSADTDAANKGYVDALINGIHWKQQVRAASTAAGTLASDFANGDMLDGVSLLTGDRILIKNQASQIENGIYIVTAGAPTRALDADSTAELSNATVFIEDGSVNADRAYTQTTNDPTIGVSNIVWTQFGAGGGTTYSADGDGIVEVATVFSLELDGTTLTKGASGLRIGSGAAGSGLSEASGVLAVNVGDGLEIATDTVQIDLAAANSGLTFSSGDLSIDSSVVVRKYAVTLGTGATSYVITHSLNTLDVTVAVYRVASPNDVIICDIEYTSVNTITLRFAVAPSSGEYRVVVHG